MAFGDTLSAVQYIALGEHRLEMYGCEWSWPMQISWSQTRMKVQNDLGRSMNAYGNRRLSHPQISILH
jgi:hypothetical protein